MNISIRYLFAFVVILILGLHATTSSNIKSGRSYHDGTTPAGEGPTTLESGPSTLQPGPTCELPDPDCLAYPQADYSSFLENGKNIASLPGFHVREASEPIEEEPDGSVITNEVITNFGKWQAWKLCPAGMYTVAIQTYNWGNWDGDNNGVSYINFLCRTPGGNEADSIIEDFPKGFKMPKRRMAHASVCKGALVGYSLYVAPKQGGDIIGTEIVEGFCSTNKTVRAENILWRALDKKKFGWTDPVHCKKYQAMCGFQAQMEPQNRDNSAMNNLMIKCCHVADPLKDCKPIEERLHIQTCDSSNSAEGLKCDYWRKIGLSVDYAMENVIIFYFSIGYDFMSIKDQMKEKIISKLKTKLSSEYSWDNPGCSVGRLETSSSATLCVKPQESVEIYQVVGRCGYFLVRSNRFVKVITKNGVEREEYLDVA